MPTFDDYLEAAITHKSQARNSGYKVIERYNGLGESLVRCKDYLPEDLSEEISNNLLLLCNAIVELGDVMVRIGQNNVDLVHSFSLEIKEIRKKVEEMRGFIP